MLTFLRRSAFSFALLGVLSSSLELCAQDSPTMPPGGGQLPVLPETEVEATPPEVSAPPVPAPAPSFDGGLFQGTIFDTPPVSGYAAESSTTASIIAIPDADLPATVNVIPQDVIRDQMVLQFDDIVRNAGGVTLAGDGLFADRIFLRGLEVGARNFRKDGFLDPTYVPRDFQNVERVEILKGPASVLYGAGDPAGLVNVITKKPVYDRFAEFGFTFGAWDRARFTLDANGVSPSGTVLYRINVAQEDAESFVDFDYLSRTQVAPVITWVIDEATTLTWNGEWHRHNSIGFQGTPAIGGNPLALPPNRFIGEPGSDFFRSEEFRQSLVFRHELSEDWAVSLGGYSLFYSFPSSTTSAMNEYPAGFFGQEAPIGRGRSDSPLSDEQSHSVIANLAGEFCAGGMLHKMVVGVEYNYFDSDSAFAFSGIGTPIPPPDFVFPLPFDAANPNYGDPDPTVFLFGLETTAFRQQRVGGYIQDLVEINEYWQVLGGVRLDTVDFEFDRVVDAGFAVPLQTEQTFERVSPRGGIVFQPLGDDVLSYFYSYSRSFNPPGGGAYFDLAPLLPVLGESHEAGMKTELVEGLWLTASGFHTVRENDSFLVSPGVLTQVGEVRSQGAEVNMLGTLTDRWSVIANYTYTDARLSDTNPLFDGRKARNVPYNMTNVWTRYDLYRDDYQTIGAALGMIYLDRRPADLENDLYLPAFTRWDAGMYWRRGAWNAAAYLENLFDKQYAASSVNELQIFQGAPFNARATISYLY